MGSIKDQIEFALFSRSPTVDLFDRSGLGHIEKYYSINNNLKIVTLLGLGWFALFSIIYLFNKKRSWEMKNLMVSFIHSVVAVIVCTWAWFNDSTIFASENTPYASFALQVSFSYFLYDFLLTLMAGLEDRLMGLHHIVSITALGIGLWTGRSGSELIQSLIFLESSNPFMHLRGILVELDTKNQYSAFVTALEAMFVLTFFLARIVFGPVLVYNLLISSTPPIMFMGTIMFSLSLYWFYVILAKVYEKFVAKKPQEASADATKKKQ